MIIRDKTSPFRWFTPVALVGGLIFLVLLSFMNFVQSSYVLSVEYANDPNSIVTNGVWFKRWPSYLTRSVQPICGSANLPTNAQFFTNQTALLYTLTGVYNASENTLIPVALPSLPYLNNVLEDCNITQILMEFDGTYDQSFIQYQNSSWGCTVRAFTTCRISGPVGRNNIDITAMYNPVPEYDIPGSSAFISRDAMTKASLYWAQKLLAAFWLDAVLAMINNSEESGIRKGYISMSPNANQTQIRTLDFFAMKFSFLKNTSDYHTYWGGTSGNIDLLQTVGYFIEEEKPPMVWTQADILAKCMYSAVMSDLGQLKSPAGSNLVLDPASLQTLSTRFKNISTPETGKPWLYTLIETQTYESMKSNNTIGPLGLSPSVISTKYLCQVPALKSTGEILISVLLADLVLLTAAWRLYTYTVDWLFLRNRSGVRYCEGCFQSVVATEVEDAQGLCVLPKITWSASSSSQASRWRPGYHRVHSERKEGS